VTDERARVEALAEEWLAENVVGHLHRKRSFLLISALTDCLLAYGAERVREALDKYGSHGERCRYLATTIKSTCDCGLIELLDPESIRARREGPAA
jgi:hypothetical protein